jgi:hypothetical protein
MSQKNLIIIAGLLLSATQLVYSMDGKKAIQKIGLSEEQLLSKNRPVFMESDEQTPMGYIMINDPYEGDNGLAFKAAIKKYQRENLLRLTLLLIYKN